MADVFISYARADKAIAQALSTLLEARGLSVWWDNRISAGDTWDETIERQLNDASCVLVLWSVASWQSSYVRAEAHHSKQRNLLLAARLDDVVVGPPFNLIQALDLRGWRGDPEHPAFASLWEAIKARVGHTETSSADSSAFIDDLRRRAEAGEAQGQFDLAWQLASGDKVEKDEVEAVRLYGLAAAQGHIWAHCNLAGLVAEGRGIAQDWALAVHHYRIAAEADDWLAQDRLGTCYRLGRGVAKDLKVALHWYERSARGGHAIGQANYGMMLENGWGCDPNPAAAVGWYRKAADQGLGSAQNSLGVCYREGVGVKKDVWEAARWFRMSAEQGHAPAQCSLGVALFQGSGVERNQVEAVRWYRRAAAQGNAQGQSNLACCLRDGTGCARNYGEAFRLFEAAAAAGNAHARYGLARLLEDGLGCDKDQARGREFLLQAARAGNEQAQKRLREQGVKWSANGEAPQRQSGTGVIKQAGLLVLASSAHTLAGLAVFIALSSEQLLNGDLGAPAQIVAQTIVAYLGVLNGAIDAARVWLGDGLGVELGMDHAWLTIFLIGAAVQLSAWIGRDRLLTSGLFFGTAGALLGALVFAVAPSSPGWAESLRASVASIGAMALGLVANEPRMGPGFAIASRRLMLGLSLVAFILCAALIGVGLTHAALLTCCALVVLFGSGQLLALAYAPRSAFTPFVRKVLFRSGIAIVSGYATALIVVILLELLF